MKADTPIDYFVAIQRAALDHDARHRHEVAVVAALATHEERREYIEGRNGVRAHRGDEAAEQLRRDVWEALKKREAHVEPLQESLV